MGGNFQSWEQKQEQKQKEKKEKKYDKKDSKDWGKLLKCGGYPGDDDKTDILMKGGPADGWLWISQRSPHFIAGKVTLRARKNGKYA